MKPSGSFNHHPDLSQLGTFTCLTFLADSIQDNGACDDTKMDGSQGHGTAVAGVAVALDNSIDVVGVAPAVGLWGSIQVCDGVGSGGCMDQGVVDGVEFLRQNGGKDIANMSVGFDSTSAALSTTVAAAWNDGTTLMVAAAGDRFSVEYPAKFSQVIAVSGTDQADGFAQGSTSGSEVEISAPFAVTTLGLVSDTSGWSGTSFAAPHVSGTAALVWTQNPAWSNAQVRDKLQTSVLDLGPAGRDEQFGFGRIDACMAVGVCPFAVSISGPDSVRAGEHCTWFGMASGGHGTFTYQWSGVLSGSGQQISGSLTSSGTLSLSVHSGDGQSDGDEIFITVSSSAPSCGL